MIGIVDEYGFEGLYGFIIHAQLPEAASEVEPRLHVRWINVKSLPKPGRGKLELTRSSITYTDFNVLTTGVF